MERSRAVVAATADGAFFPRMKGGARRSNGSTLEVILDSQKLDTTDAPG